MTAPDRPTGPDLNAAPSVQVKQPEPEPDRPGDSGRLPSAASLNIVANILADDAQTCGDFMSLSRRFHLAERILVALRGVRL